MNSTQLNSSQTDHISELAQVSWQGRGRGFEPLAQRAIAFVDWLEASTERAIMDNEAYTNADEVAAEIAAARADIAAAIEAEHDTGKRILALAGGAGWGDGLHVVKFNGGGMAARAARYMVGGGGGRFSGRGVRPSQTSLEDAAAAAAAAMWFEWLCWQALMGEDVAFDAARHRLCGVAWRAAFASLTRDAGEGRTGRKAGQGEHDGGAAAPLDDVQLQLAKLSLDAWASDRQGRIFDQGDTQDDRQRRARRRVLSWLRDVLGVRAKGRTGAAERSRFSVLARLIHGRDISTAAKAAGFANGRQAIESFRTGKVWERLRATVANHRGHAERKLTEIRKRAAARAVVAIRAQRRLATGAGAYGVAGYAERDTKRVWRNGTGGGIGGKLVTVDTRKPAARVMVSNPFAAEWSATTTERGEAVAEAHAARAMLTEARRERVEQFNSATKGLRAGWLRN